MSFYTHLPQRIDGETADAAKGILILFVVLGHAANFFTPEPFPFLAIKFFHVASFLLLPFMYDVKPLTFALLRDRTVRYYVPFFCFLLFYGVLYLAAMRGPGEVGPWLFDLIKAFIFGNGQPIDQAAGLSALWFLPAYLTISMAIALVIGRWRVGLPVLLAGTFLLNGAAGWIPDPLKHYLPLGLVNVCFLFFLGTVLRTVFHYIDRETLEKISPAFLLVTILLCSAAYVFETYIKFPIIYLPSFSEPHDLLIQDGIILSAVMFLLSTPKFKHAGWLKFFGRQSLQIYLLHLPFVLLPSVLLRKYLSSAPDDILAWGVVSGLFASGIAGALMLNCLLGKAKSLKYIMFPRDWESWKQSFRLR